jgi:hypothetical protein
MPKKSPMFQVNLSIELCAGKLTIEESPQRWDGVETKSGNKSSFSFSFDAEKPADRKERKFYGGELLNSRSSTALNIREVMIVQYFKVLEFE